MTAPRTFAPWLKRNSIHPYFTHAQQVNNDETCLHCEMGPLIATKINVLLRREEEKNLCMYHLCFPARHFGNKEIYT